MMKLQDSLKKVSDHHALSNVIAPLSGVLEIHGCMNIPQLTILFAHDPLSSLTYPIITHRPPVASKFACKSLVTRQQPTRRFIH